MNKFNKFLIGCCYYPEHWNRDDMQKDVNKIKELGFNVIRMGEFSWSAFEKTEGNYDFSVLEQAVQLADAAGLSVILGTPTAAPPIWLTEKYPEILCVNYNRTTMEHGSRQHHNHTSEIYLEYCARITKAMVSHFKAYKNVIGWQIDNEINCHRNESFSDSDDKAFAQWLENKYLTVENLNRCWGNCFWSLDYNDFSQVKCPRPNPAYPNPSHMIDYYLFLSDTVLNYVTVQTKIIREIMPEAFITHNGYFKNVNYEKLTDECLDILSYDSYPAGHERLSPNGARNVSYKHALTRCASPEYLVLEQQAGPGGQLHYLHPSPRPGQLRLWTYQSIAYGAIGVLYFRYRTALFGAEQLWYGIYGHDGEENYRSKEVRETALELSRIGDLFLNNRIKNEVAILRDYHNDCANAVERFASDDTLRLFTSLNAKNIHADFITPDKDFSAYKVLIVPHFTVCDESLARKVEDFAKAGGTVIISARSGVKDENAHYRPQKAPAIFSESVGADVDWFTAMPEYAKQSVIAFGKEYEISSYYETLEVVNAEVLGTYTDDYAEGKPAIVKNGNIIYIGCYFNRSIDIYADIIESVIGVGDYLADNVEIIDLDNYKLYLNHTANKVPFNAKDVIKNEIISELAPYGVALVEKTK